MTWLLALVALAFTAFAALDVDEFLHQLDVNQNGLAVLVAGIAQLHTGASVVGATRASRARRLRPGSPGAAGPMPA